jgi:hypothetical protein
MTLQHLLGLGLLLLAADPALGLGLVSDDRIVTWGCTSTGCDRVFTPEAPFAPMRDSSISVTPDGLGIDANAHASYFVGSGPGGERLTSATLFSIAFRIDGPGTLELDGCLQSGYYDGAGHGLVRVLAGTQEIFSREATNVMTCPDDSFAYSTDLAPGIYTVAAEARAHTMEDVRFDLDFHVRDTAHPIPEPATALALGAGLAILGGARRATRARHPAGYSRSRIDPST